MTAAALPHFLILCMTAAAPLHFLILCRENNCPEAPDPGDRGQPGFTANEQSRFADIKAAGGLVDAYRELHATAAWQDCVTWRGAAGRDVAESGRYYNKGMRIDLFMLHASLKDRIDEVEVCGCGPNLEGFLGSDHSPLLLRLRTAAPDNEAAAATAMDAAQTAEPLK
jgi:exonuclease III